MVIYVCGHLDLTEEEFYEHYAGQFGWHILGGDLFVIGDAPGADFLSQKYLYSYGANVIVYHMYDTPRNCVEGISTQGGFTSDKERDEAMMQISDKVIGWVRKGRENSATAKNIELMKLKEEEERRKPKYD